LKPFFLHQKKTKMTSEGQDLESLENVNQEDEDGNAEE